MQCKSVDELCTELLHENTVRFEPFFGSLYEQARLSTRNRLRYEGPYSAKTVTGETDAKEIIAVSNKAVFLNVLVK